ncbi:MAG: RNase adapter RapZ [Pseudomonadota bacterium]
MRAIIISGLSGSGKTSAIKALEDAGYYCIDNLPVPLLRAFFELSSHSAAEIQKVALGLDARDKIHIGKLPETLKQLAVEGHSFELLFLDASDEVLARRFSETRRKHPLALEGSPVEGIRKERELLKPVRDMAAHVFDTSTMRTTDLRQQVVKRYMEPSQKPSLSVQVVSFGFKHGLPLNADLVFDVRFLPNPFFKEDLKRLNGMHPDVIDYVMAKGEASELLKELKRLMRFMIPRFDREGKSYLTIAVGCTGGKHRSVVIAKNAADFVEKLGYPVTLVHRDMELE